MPLRRPFSRYLLFKALNHRLDLRCILHELIVPDGLSAMGNDVVNGLFDDARFNHMPGGVLTPQLFKRFCEGNQRGVSPDASKADYGRVLLNGRTVLICQRVTGQGGSGLVTFIERLDHGQLICIKTLIEITQTDLCDLDVAALMGVAVGSAL